MIVYMGVYPKVVVDSIQAPVKDVATLSQGLEREVATSVRSSNQNLTQVPGGDTESNSMPKAMPRRLAPLDPQAKALVNGN